MTHPTHRTRYSDSSLYDEVCELCGATDSRGGKGLKEPCPSSIQQTHVRPAVALSPTVSQMAKDPGCHPKIVKDALTDEDALDRDVFLIVGTSGFHSNASNWVTGVFLELESARHYLLSLKKWFDSKGLEASAIFPDQVGVCLDGFEWGDLKEVAEREGRAHAVPLDPRACFEYDGIAYRIINVPLRG